MCCYGILYGNDIVCHEPVYSSESLWSQDHYSQGASSSGNGDHALEQSVAMITRKVDAAIVADKTVVVKPAPETPLCALAIGKLFERAGLPKGVMNIVTCNLETTSGWRRAVQQPVNEAPQFRREYGGWKAVERALCEAVKKTSKELGGDHS